ncbi:MAG TPA: STM3941 family protein [Trebonia sp.]
MSSERVEIRPNVARNVALLAVGASAFVAAGVWMAIGQSALEYRFVGVLTIVFFGYCLTRIPALAGRKVSLVLTPSGLEQVYPQGVATIPWAEVAAVGVASTGHGRPMAGILLHSYERYLTEMPPKLAAHFERTARFMKPVAAATAFVARGQARGTLADYSRTRGMASRLAWQRERFGYDVLLTWSELDRPAQDFTALLHEYVTRYHSRLNRGAGR